MATLYKVDGSEQEVLPANGKGFTLDEMQALVGGYVQVIYLPDGSPCLMDEDGKSKNKPINQRATLMGRVAGTQGGDCIVGDFVVCKREELGD